MYLIMWKPKRLKELKHLILSSWKNMTLTFCELRKARTQWHGNLHFWKLKILKKWAIFFENLNNRKKYEFNFVNLKCLKTWIHVFTVHKTKKIMQLHHLQDFKISKKINLIFESSKNMNYFFGRSNSNPGLSVLQLFWDCTKSKFFSFSKFLLKSSMHVF